MPTLPFGDCYWMTHIIHIHWYMACKIARGAHLHRADDSVLPENRHFAPAGLLQLSHLLLCKALPHQLFALWLLCETARSRHGMKICCLHHMQA